MQVSLRDHMTKKLHTVSEDSTVAEALSIMRNRWIRHLPVVDVGGEFVVGIVSDRDLANAPSIQSVIRSVMTTPVQIFEVATPVESIVHAMIEEKVSAFLVTDQEEVIGIVTSEDMLVLLSQILEKGDRSRLPTLSEILMNPMLQKTMNSVSQAGI